MKEALKEYINDTVGYSKFPCAFCGTPTEGTKGLEGIDHVFCTNSCFGNFMHECKGKELTKNQIDKLLSFYRYLIYPEWINSINGEFAAMPFRKRTIENNRTASFIRSMDKPPIGMPEQWKDFYYGVNGVCPEPPEGFKFTHPLFVHLNNDDDFISSSH